MEIEKVNVKVTINGKERSAEVEPRTLLAHFIRDELHLTGTHIGCDTSQCGACTVMVDGQAVKSCTLLAVQADGSEITTVEGLGTSRELASDSAKLLGKAWLAMWVLYARCNDGIRCSITRKSKS